MNQIDIGLYHEFVQNQLKVTPLFEKLKDARKRPQIPAGVIAQAIVYALSAGQKSFLSIDNLLKQSDLGSVLGCERFPVCSDSLMIEVLKSMDPQEVRQILYQTAEVLIRVGLAASPQGCSGLRTCALDGSTMLGRDVVVCYWISCAPYVPLDFEPVLKGENEITAAKRLLVRVLKRFGWAIDVVVGDGLYTGWFFKICLDHGKQAVAKLRQEDERDLKILEAVRQRLEQQRFYGVEAQKGVDEDGQHRWELRELGEWEAFDLEVKIRVLWEYQEPLKGPRGPQERFLMTTLPKNRLEALEVRKLGRWRWRIENNGFREMNQKMGRKHRYTKHETAAQVMMGLILVAHATLQGYVFERRQRDPALTNPKCTIDWMMKLLLGSLLALKPKPRQDEPAQPMLFSPRTLRRLRRPLVRAKSG